MKRAWRHPRRLVVVATAVVVFRACPAYANDADPWFGRDKTLHFGVSAALAATGYAASSPFWSDIPPRAATGAGISLTFGAAKELYDWTGPGTASWKDFTWDVIGAAVGVGACVLIDAMLLQKDEKGRGPGVARAELRF